MKNLKTYVLKYSIPIFSTIAIIICIYLLYVHYTAIIVACPDVGIINCGRVLTSNYSEIFNIPLPVFGIIYFVFLLVLSFLKKTENIIFILSIISLFVVALLVYIEFGILHSVCLYCSTIHLIAIIIFFVSLYKYLFRKELKL
jgi:uncharacterized membrane protein